MFEEKTALSWAHCIIGEINCGTLLPPQTKLTPRRETADNTKPIDRER
jgi:hypothetical protein